MLLAHCLFLNYVTVLRKITSIYNFVNPEPDIPEKERLWKGFALKKTGQGYKDLWHYHMKCVIFYVATTQEQILLTNSTPKKLDLLQGTLDVMVLQTLATMGPLHGYGVARRIEQTSGNQVMLNQGTIYASLVRLQQRGLISAKWGTSENNRKAKFYTITRRGAQKLAADADYWQRLADVMGRVFAAPSEDSSP